MKAIGLMVLIFGLMLQATGEHWENYLMMLVGLGILWAGYKLERG
jgi:hypothetical protein